MKLLTKSFAVLLVLTTIQSFSMSRLLSRATGATRAAALRSASLLAVTAKAARAQAPFVRSLQLSRTQARGLHTAVKPTVSSQAAKSGAHTRSLLSRIALKGALGATAAGLALYPQTARAETNKPEEDNEREIITTFGHIDSLVHLIEMEKQEENEIDRIVSELSFLSYHIEHLEKIDGHIYASNQKVPQAREFIKNELLIAQKRVQLLLEFRSKHAHQLNEIKEARAKQYDNVVSQD